MVNDGLIEGISRTGKDVAARPALKGDRRIQAPPLRGVTRSRRRGRSGLGGDADDHRDHRGRDTHTAFVPSPSPRRSRAARRWCGHWRSWLPTGGMRWRPSPCAQPGRVTRRRRLTIDRQVIETRSGLKLTMPRAAAPRVTSFPSGNHRPTSTRPTSSTSLGEGRARRADSAVSAPASGRGGRKSGRTSGIPPPHHRWPPSPGTLHGHWAWKFPQPPPSVRHCGLSPNRGCARRTSPGSSPILHPRPHASTSTSTATLLKGPLLNRPRYQD